MDVDPFCFMRDCLREFNYPQIDSMDDVKITDIFSKENRLFLVGWIFKQLDEDYWEIVENCSKEELEDLACCNGFCSEAVKTKFMDGECDVSLQVTVLFKMFQYLKSISDVKKHSGDTATVLLTEVESLLKLDTNLFPMYGPQQTLTHAEQIENLQNYRKEIEDIKKRFESNGQIHSEINPTLKDHLKTTMEHLDQNFPPFAEKIIATMKNKDSVDTNEIGFNEDFEKMLTKSNEYLKIIMKFLKSVNIVTNFKESKPDLEDVNNSNTMVRELSQLCKDISELKKRNC